MKLILFECVSRDGCESFLDKTIRLSSEPTELHPAGGDDEATEVEIGCVELNEGEIQRLSHFSPEKKKEELFAKFDIVDFSSGPGYPKGPYYHISEEVCSAFAQKSVENHGGVKMNTDNVINSLIARKILREINGDGSKAFKFAGDRDVDSVEESEFRKFVDAAIEKGQAKMVCNATREVGGPVYHSPDDPNSVQYAVDTAEIQLSLNKAEPLLTIGNFSEKETFYK